MKRPKLTLVVCLSLAGAVPLPRLALAEANETGAVFVMSNAASDNKIEAYARHENGSLEFTGSFATGGNGSGGTVDPLHSQGSLRLSADHHLLFAVNAGSGTVSSFRVDGSTLTLIDTAASGGSSPTALAQAGGLLYVLNSGGNGNVSGLRVAGDGHLHSIPSSTRNLSDTATSPTSLAFSPNGQFLVVTETATNKIDVFHVLPNGTLSTIAVNASAGATPFAAVFAPNGTLIVGNASNTISSYKLDWDQTLDVVSDALLTLGAATCWDVVTPNGGAVYTANAGTSNLSGFTIEHNGSLTPIGATIVGTNPSGSSNLDTAVSANGKFVYTLNAGAGAIGEFSVESGGGLLSFGQVGGLPAASGLNGIAAY
jgi:6-phosphogluconolactonase (cycloisomerase 2 family)